MNIVLNQGYFFFKERSLSNSIIKFFLNIPD